MAVSQKSVAACVIALDAMNAQLLNVAPNPTLQIYEGSMPADLETAPAPTTLLAQLPMITGAPFGAAYTSGVANAQIAADATTPPGLIDNSVLQTGLATYWRIYTNFGSGQAIYQGDVTETDLGGSLTFSPTTSFIAGGLCQVDSLLLNLAE
jgi:hypothetical protein